ALLEEHARSDMGDEGLDLDRAVPRRYVDVRYVGQSFELTVDYPARYRDLTRTIAGAFHKVHRQRFGYADVSEPVEIVNLRLKMVVPVDKPMPDPDVPSGTSPAEALAGEGIEAEVINLRTLRPLDMEAIKTSVAKTNRAVVVEEGWPQCSIASEVSARLMEEAFDDLDAPVERVSNADVPMPYAANLEKLALISAEDVIRAAKKVCYRS
ncbi:MAG: hypothetical protein IIA70_05830, partial [Proteobacteria bacterium]|nr:hypothetical protein [Pseudomonadota bacterium]